MEIIKATTMGYCMGVRRAMELAEKAVKDYPNKKIFTLGPLIHNQVALDSLFKKGIEVLYQDKIELLCNENTVVIIRAHGVPPKTLDLLEKTKTVIINATCPRVLSNQKRASEFAKKQCTVIIAGDKNHGEVSGLEGFIQKYCNKSYVIQNSSEAKQLAEKLDPNENSEVVLLSQTTISQKEYEAIGFQLIKKFPDILIQNTICPATKERQAALDELCKESDGIIVIGGKLSANTCRLFYTAQENTTKSEYKSKYACHIENPSEIPQVFYTLNRVGLTAGASTPDNVIDDVEKALMLQV